MGRLLVRDVYTREFEIDKSALPYWPHVEVIREIPEIGEEPAGAEPAEPAPGEPGDLKPAKSKAAPRPASDV
jgi:hypothetical protein